MQTSILETIYIKVKDANKGINNMQNKIYKYFSETHRQVKDKEITEY